jgi:hypothetical protein
MKYHSGFKPASAKGDDAAEAIIEYMVNKDAYQIVACRFAVIGKHFVY